MKTDGTEELVLKTDGTEELVLKTDGTNGTEGKKNQGRTQARLRPMNYYW